MNGADGAGGCLSTAPRPCLRIYDPIFIHLYIHIPCLTRRYLSVLLSDYVANTSSLNVFLDWLNAPRLPCWL